MGRSSTKVKLSPLRTSEFSEQRLRAAR